MIGRLIGLKGSYDHYVAARMKPAYEVSAEAQQDLFEIWRRIAEDSVDMADRINAEFHAKFLALAETPRMGHSRKDLTLRPVLFFPLHSFLSSMPQIRFRFIS